MIDPTIHQDPRPVAGRVESFAPVLGVGYGPANLARWTWPTKAARSGRRRNLYEPPGSSASVGVARGLSSGDTQVGSLVGGCLVGMAIFPSSASAGVILGVAIRARVAVAFLLQPATRSGVMVKFATNAAIQHSSEHKKNRLAASVASPCEGTVLGRASSAWSGGGQRL